MDAILMLEQKLTGQRQVNDFRIKANASKSSFKDTMSGTTSQTEREKMNIAKKIGRPHLIGLNKPHQLKGQNDQIKKMLGKPVDEPLEPDASDMLSQKSKNTNLDSSRKLNPIRQSSLRSS